MDFPQIYIFVSSSCSDLPHSGILSYLLGISTWKLYKNMHLTSCKLKPISTSLLPASPSTSFGLFCATVSGSTVQAKCQGIVLDSFSSSTSFRGSSTQAYFPLIFLVPLFSPKFFSISREAHHNFLCGFIYTLLTSFPTSSLGSF